MKRETIEAMEKTADDIGMSDRFSFTHEYSGRGMFGKVTSGVTFGNLGNLLQLVAATAASLTQEDDEAASEAFIDGFSTVRTDNMGHDTIAY